MRHALLVLLALLLTSGARAQHDHAAHTPPGAAQASTGSSWDFFTNFGTYMPRTHCVVGADGKADWPWISILITLTLGVIVAYGRIYYFWIKTHHEQESRDRNKKMFELANIFFWCAVCGYGFSVLAFAWPAYRLLAIALFLLNIWSWKFILTDLDEFKQSLCSKAREREFREELQRRNETLAAEVLARTKELEAARKRAEEASLAKSQFLASMSHEIRTPMTAILGYAELLSDEIGSREGDHRLREATETIFSNSQHLLMVIDDILDVSKIEAGRMKLEIVPFNPAEVVESVRQLLERKALAKGLELVVAYEPGIPALIESDPTRFRRILLNLVGNAIKFTNDGRVTVRVAYDRTKQRLSLEVRDTGIGMSAEQLSRIQRFEPFSQADETMTRRFGGTGLGLKISRDLTRMLGGGLIVDSLPGRGTTVRFIIDARTDAKAETLEAPELAGSGHAHYVPNLTPDEAMLRGVSVLLVDDGEDNQRLFKVLLSAQGASITLASDGQEALDLVTRCGRDAFDLILMDMQMPVLDGREATRRLRAMGFGRPIIALTAHAMQGAREECVGAGCDDYLTKPIDRQTLVAACAKWAARRDHRRAA